MSNKRADALFSLITPIILFFGAVTAVVVMSDLIVMVRDRVCPRVNKFFKGLPGKFFIKRPDFENI